MTLEECVQAVHDYEVYDPKYDVLDLVYDTKQGWFVSDSDFVPIEGVGFWAISRNKGETFWIQLNINEDDWGFQQDVRRKFGSICETDNDGAWWYLTPDDLLTLAKVCDAYERLMS